MPSSSCVLAFEEPPNQLMVLPCANSASTSRGCTTPRSRTNSSTAFACFQRAFVHTVRGVRGCIRWWVPRGRKP